MSEDFARYANLVDNISIEKTGADISILRIANASDINSGRYACTAKNPLGEDSTSVNIAINGMYMIHTSIQTLVTTISLIEPNSY